MTTGWTRIVAAAVPGYGALGPPSGKYIAPANILECIETIVGEGKCGLRTANVQGPGIVSRIRF